MTHLCTECWHSRLTGSMVSCYEKRNMKKSLADGRERPRFDCDYLRDNVEYCGAAAAWFVPRETTKGAAK